MTQPAFSVVNFFEIFIKKVKNDIMTSMFKEIFKKHISNILADLGVENPLVTLDTPTHFHLGDYSTSVALVYAKELGKKPMDVAEEIKEKLEEKIKEEKIAYISKIETVAPGFINFFLSSEYFVHKVGEIISQKEKFGENKNLDKQKIMVEFTDANPFKEFHIGHFMSNSIGESISRLLSFGGAEVKRANWQGDIGMHVAKAVWGMIQLGLDEKATPNDLGKAYAYGSEKSEDESVKKEIILINKKIFSREDEKINHTYNLGRKISLDYFETIYKKLGTKFDYYFFESEEGPEGKAIVEEFLKKGVFEESDGAIVFKGEKYDPTLHTRVFINSEGLPTYEAKELGLNRKKFIKEPSLSHSVIITGNEIREYFKVLLAVMHLVYPDIAEKTKHIPHGMLRLPQGKMSSRTGNVITAEALISEVKEKILEKMTGREMTNDEKEGTAEMVAIGAIKYSILRQAIGGDIIFDFDKSISFEGDSGPYLQYSAVRANSILKKAEMSKCLFDTKIPDDWQTTNLERILERYPSVVEKATQEYAPHYVVTYLIQLAGEFNSFYASHTIIDEKDSTSPYRLALTKAFSEVIVSGLDLLGIKVPNQM